MDLQVLGTWNIKLQGEHEIHTLIFRGEQRTQIMCGISGQNSSHLTGNVTLSTSTPDPVIWTAFVLNREKLL